MDSMELPILQSGMTLSQIMRRLNVWALVIKAYFDRLQSQIDAISTWIDRSLEGKIKATAYPVYSFLPSLDVGQGVLTTLNPVDIVGFTWSGVTVDGNLVTQGAPTSYEALASLEGTVTVSVRGAIMGNTVRSYFTSSDVLVTVPFDEPPNSYFFCGCNEERDKFVKSHLVGTGEDAYASVFVYHMRTLKFTVSAGMGTYMRNSYFLASGIVDNKCIVHERNSYDGFSLISVGILDVDTGVVTSSSIAGIYPHSPYLTQFYGGKSLIVEDWDKTQQTFTDVYAWNGVNLSLIGDHLDYGRSLTDPFTFSFFYRDGAIIYGEADVATGAGHRILCIGFDNSLLFNYALDPSDSSLEVGFLTSDWFYYIVRNSSQYILRLLRPNVLFQFFTDAVQYAAVDQDGNICILKTNTRVSLDTLVITPLPVGETFNINVPARFNMRDYHAGDSTVDLEFGATYLNIPNLSVRYWQRSR